MNIRINILKLIMPLDMENKQLSLWLRYSNSVYLLYSIIIGTSTIQTAEEDILHCILTYSTTSFFPGQSRNMKFSYQCDDLRLYVQHSAL
jgi:hypothetical protein